MRRKQFLGVVLALGLVLAVMAAEIAETQGPVESDPPQAQSGTAETGREHPQGQSGTAGTGLEHPLAQSGTAGTRPEHPLDRSTGEGRQEEDAALEPAAGYNATIRIPVAALKPRESNVEWGVGGDGGCAYASSGDRYTWWAAPLYLPDGATLRYFRMYYNDQDATINCAAYLTVYDLFGRIVVEWGIFSRDVGQDYVTTEELDHQIDYSKYNYVINWSPNTIGPDMQVCGFRVYYEYTWGAAFLPSVMKGH